MRANGRASGLVLTSRFMVVLNHIQVEMDEYQNYEKALGALNEAVKCMAKASAESDRNSHEQKVNELKMKMG